jgi:hypothetical protein
MGHPLGQPRQLADLVEIGVKSHFQLKRAQTQLVVSARHRELVDAEFGL